jgi:hypothetical protein
MQMAQAAPLKAACFTTPSVTTNCNSISSPHSGLLRSIRWVALISIP